MKAEDATLTEMKWYKLTVIADKIEATGRKILRSFIQLHDQGQTEAMTEDGINPCYHLSRIMTLGQQGVGEDGPFSIFPLCLNKAHAEDLADDTPFELYHPLRDDTIEHILNSYLVENNSSFAIQELFDNCLVFSRNLLENKKTILTSRANHIKFFSEESAVKRKPKAKVIPSRIKEVVDRDLPFSPREPQEVEGEEGKKTLKVEVPTESDLNHLDPLLFNYIQPYKMLLLHNCKTFNNRDKYSSEQLAKEKGEEVKNPEAKLKKKSEKIKKSLKKQSKAIH